MYKIAALFLLLTITAKAQTCLDSIEADIKNLPKAEVQAYWETIFSAFNANNGGEIPHTDAADAINLYKTALMVHYYGYPTESKYGYLAFTTPWLTWTHCRCAGLRQYTYGMMIQGDTLGGLPKGYFPNSFVGRWLNDLYGLDMQYDTSFNRADTTIVEAAHKSLTATQETMTPAKLKELTAAYLAMLDLKPVQTLGEWMIPQHGSNNYFSILQLTDGNWYLQTRNENAPTRRPLKASANLKRFDFRDGFNDFYLTIIDGKLEIRDRKGRVVKVSG